MNDKIRVVVEIVNADKIVNLPADVLLNWNFEHRANQKNIIGEARVERVAGKIYGELLFYSSSGEPSSHPNYPLWLSSYPCIGGRVLEREGTEIKKFELTEVGVCLGPNVDPNVKTIGEQLKEQSHGELEVRTLSFAA